MSLRPNRKQRILWCSESPDVNTGYGVYTKHVLFELAKTGEFELAQLSSCTRDDFTYQNKYPWRIYPVEPAKDNQPLIDIYNSSRTNPFGAWRFEQTCLSFLPDIVVGIRDWWAEEYQLRSPYSRYFYSVQMPTVDSVPQHKQWTESYDSMDALLTYSDWGRDALIEQMGEIPWGGRTSPAASLAYFPQDRTSCRSKLGIPPHAVVFGFVGRNQRRKLFPTLIEAFDAISGGVDCYLICHTSYPDAGWDVNALIKECQNPQKILFTYRCSCGAFSLRPFQSVVAKCGKCGEVASALCNVDRGLDDDDLATVYNCMDLYVQACSNEGFGMPVTEAAACGVAIAVTDYSATEDFVEKLGAIPIPVASLQKEVDTGTDKATLSPESISSIMRGVINTPREYLIKQGQETRKLYEVNYRSYKDVGVMWANTFRSLSLRDWAETWASPAKLFRPLPPPQSLNDSGEASRWLINNVLGEPERLNTLYHARLNRDIALGFKRPTAGGEYNHELPISMMTHESVNFDSLYSNLCARRSEINACEERRVAIWRR